MPLVCGQNRNQLMYCDLESMVAPDSIARIVDAFVDSLDLDALGIGKEEELLGRPSYDCSSMLKLYVYGYRKGIRSSRKLAESCYVNLEVKWLTYNVAPDFRTIADFRKDNVASLKAVFREFNNRLAGAVEWGFTSIDGSKFLADNSTAQNFTQAKLSDRIRLLNSKCEEYIRELDEQDKREARGEESEVLTKESTAEKLAEAQERLAEYKAYEKIMEDAGLTQLSLTDMTDAQSRLMKVKNGFEVCYNPQTAVDSNTHLIRDFNMTNQVMDLGQLGPAMENIRRDDPDKVLVATADKGYMRVEDIMSCLENGIIPHVIPLSGDSYELETMYEECPDADVNSTNRRDITVCLRAGLVPEAYKDVITKITIKEVKRFVPEESADAADTPETSLYGAEEEMRRTAEEGNFVRDPERNIVYCPAGEILRQKTVKKNGSICYRNKIACRYCQLRGKCINGSTPYKEVQFSKDTLIRECKALQTNTSDKASAPAPPRAAGTYVAKKVVKIQFRPNKSSRRLSASSEETGFLVNGNLPGLFPKSREGSADSWSRYH